MGTNGKGNALKFKFFDNIVLMNLGYFIFRNKILTKLNFEELKMAYQNQLGNKYHRGVIKSNYISLYYFKEYTYFPSLSRFNAMQFTINKNDQIDGKQVIKFKRTDNATVRIILLILIISGAYIFIFQDNISVAIYVSAFIYLVSVDLYSTKLVSFKTDLKQIEKKLKNHTTL